MLQWKSEFVPSDNGMSSIKKTKFLNFYATRTFTTAPQFWTDQVGAVDPIKNWLSSGHILNSLFP